MRIKCSECGETDNADLTEGLQEKVEAGVAIHCWRCNKDQIFVNAEDEAAEQIAALKKIMIPKPDALLDYLEGNFEEFDRNDGNMAWPGMEPALVGFTDCWTGPGHPLRLIYDEDRCLAVLMERDGMTYEGAREVLDSMVDGYVGVHTPIVIYRGVCEEYQED